MSAPNHLPKVGQIMTRNVVTFSPQQEIVQAMSTLIDRHLSGAPVLDDIGHIVGMLSKKDCLKAALNASYYQQWGGKVADYMTADVQTLDPDMDVLAAAHTFLASPYRRFPVSRQGELLGQVSRIDLLSCLAGLWK